MCRTARVAAAVLLLTGSTLAPRAFGAPHDAGRAQLVVRVYATDAVGRTHVAPALPEAEAVLRSAGIGVDWVFCATAPAPFDPCAAPLASTEVTVRIVEHSPPAERRGELPLGDSIVDRGSRTGSLATVYLDRVIRLAREDGVEPEPLLGRAIAHELGHLLLGSVEHAPTGIMRAVWSRRQVRDSRLAAWQFHRDDAAEMRAALAERRAAGRTASTQGAVTAH